MNEFPYEVLSGKLSNGETLWYASKDQGSTTKGGFKTKEEAFTWARGESKRFKVVNTWPSNVFDSGEASRADYMDEKGLGKFLQALTDATRVISVGESFSIERIEDGELVGGSQ